MSQWNTSIDSPNANISGKLANAPSVHTIAAVCEVLYRNFLEITMFRPVVIPPPNAATSGSQPATVRLGAKNARVYHWFLLIAGMACAVGFVMWRYIGPFQYLFVLSFPFFIYNGIQVSKKQQPAELDQYLKQLSLSTLLFVFLFGIGLALSL